MQMMQNLYANSIKKTSQSTKCSRQSKGMRKASTYHKFVIESIFKWSGSWELCSYYLNYLMFIKCASWELVSRAGPIRGQEELIKRRINGYTNSKMGSSILRCLQISNLSEFGFPGSVYPNLSNKFSSLCFYQVPLTSHSVSFPNYLNSHILRTS